MHKYFYYSQINIWFTKTYHIKTYHYSCLKLSGVSLLFDAFDFLFDFHRLVNKLHIRMSLASMSTQHSLLEFILFICQLQNICASRFIYMWISVYIYKSLTVRLGILFLFLCNSSYLFATKIHLASQLVSQLVSQCVPFSTCSESVHL